MPKELESDIRETRESLEAKLLNGEFTLKDLGRAMLSILDHLERIATIYTECPARRWMERIGMRLEVVLTAAIVGGIVYCVVMAAQGKLPLP